MISPSRSVASRMDAVYQDSAARSCDKREPQSSCIPEKKKQDPPAMRDHDRRILRGGMLAGAALHIQNSVTRPRGEVRRRPPQADSLSAASLASWTRSWAFRDCGIRFLPQEFP
jgi:hypothetical protein